MRGEFSNMRKILRFTASWCGPCKIMSKQLESVNTNIPIEVIDIDVFPEISVEYGIRSVPTLVMIEDNIEVKRVTGTKSQQELKEWVTYGN